jgi:hypothetical protein
MDPDTAKAWIWISKRSEYQNQDPDSVNLGPKNCFLGGNFSPDQIRNFETPDLNKLNCINMLFKFLKDRYIAVRV